MGNSCDVKTRDNAYSKMKRLKLKICCDKIPIIFKMIIVWTDPYVYWPQMHLSHVLTLTNRYFILAHKRAHGLTLKWSGKLRVHISYIWNAWPKCAFIKNINVSGSIFDKFVKFVAASIIIILCRLRALGRWIRWC